MFAKHPPPLPDDDAAAAMQDWIEARTAAAGYRHYEVSAYAQPGRECRHNLNYWGFGDYLGVGAGAHSKISFPASHPAADALSQPGESIWGTPAALEFVAEHVEVPRDELPFEFMLNAMRLLEGVPARWFSERTGLPPSVIDASLREAEASRSLDG